MENLLVGDELRTDLESVRQHIERVGPDNVVCVLTTTSCFAPRSADSIVEVAKLCAAADVGHVVNNAYGVQVSTNPGDAMVTDDSLSQEPVDAMTVWLRQSARLCALVTSAWRKGRVDAVVQSTDKNFMVRKTFAKLLVVTMVRRP